MADQSDMDIFDSTISGEGSAQANPDPVHQEQHQQPARPRDEGGKFAPKPQEIQPVANAPVIETPAPGNEPAPNGNGTVPVSAVQAEREKRQTAQHEAEALRREIAELRGMVQANRQPAPMPQQETTPVTIWDDPDGFLKGQIAPLQNQFEEMREMLWESQATQRHTAEAVQAAKDAATAVFGTPQGAALHQQITASGNPFDNLVKWHKQQQAFARVGDDPDAFIAAEIEKRMSDPAFLASAVERARAGATSNANRSQPLTNLPPSLSRLPAGGNAPIEGDVGDGALFTSLTSGRR
jgi:hypothetical protein